MLQHLRIQNFAIIADCEIDFKSEMTTLTGETGAGKSIIIDAISLLMGKSASEDWIRSGCDEAVLEAVFSLEKKHTSPALLDYLGDDSQLIVHRRLSRSKASVCRLNGQAVPLKLLKLYLKDLIAIVGQHEHMSLADPDYQLVLLDAFGFDEMRTVKHSYDEVWQRYSRLKTMMSKKNRSQSDIRQRIEFLSFQVADIETYNFILGEEDLLLSQRKSVKNKAKMEVTFEALDTHLSTILESLGEAKKYSGDLSVLDPQFNDWASVFDTLELELSEKNRELHSKRNALSDLSEWSIDDLESRLNEMFKAKQKFSVSSIQEVLGLLESHSQEISELKILVSDDADLEGQLKTVKKELLDIAKQVHMSRCVLAQSLSLSIKEKLLGLHFQYVDFKINVVFDEDSLCEQGADSVSFEVSTNKGEPLKAISSVASGGELSRILLAVRVVFSDVKATPTMIFDEVDTGIGGLTANTVGAYLRDISQRSQVLCITHLPQVAKVATHQLYVEKNMDEFRTSTIVRYLSKTEREVELKRMLGGDAVLSVFA
jgi:DNA repair protein RecN (Recombination protein N)